MWRNYLTVGVRALAKNKTYAFINIFGLSVGIAACLLILSYVRYEFSYDAWLPNADRAYQLQTIYHATAAGQAEAVSQTTAIAAGQALKKDFPQLERVVYASSQGAVFVQDGQPTTTDRNLITDGALFDVLEIPFVRGDRVHALDDPHALVMSESEAKKRYGDENPIGKTLTVISSDMTADYRVTGVFKDIPKNSHLAATIVLRVDPPEYFKNSPDAFKSWRWQNGQIYAKLKPAADVGTINAQFPAWEKRNIPNDTGEGPTTNPGDDVDFDLVNIRDIHIGKSKGPAVTTERGTVLTFAVVALLILAMACMNFTNLATARASQRAREVALRKVLGATRRQLVTQFIGESILVSAIATLIALALTELSLPALNAFLDAQIQLRYFGTDGILLPVLLLGLVVGLAGGLYPAFYLSRFEPARVLKANKSAANAEGTGRLRNLLVITQFAVSIGLIICTAVIYGQTIYARTIEAGFEKDDLIQIGGVSRPQVENVSRSLVEEIRKLPGVTAVGRTDIGVATGNNSTTSVNRPGRTDGPELGIYAIDTHLIDALGMKLVAGRNLSETIAADDITLPTPPTPEAEQALFERGANALISESAVQRLGFASSQAAIGQQVKVGLVTDRNVTVTIAGVVGDVRYRSARDAVQPIIYFYSTTGLNNLLVRFNGNPATMSERVGAVWKRLVPDIPYTARFATDLVHDMYNADETRAQLFGMSAVLAVTIGCLGLFGLASFTAEQRTREIGIRKVLGARSRDIVRLLAWQFSKPVIVANLIAWPVAWWVMRDWLNTFDTRIDLGPTPFVLAGLLALAIAIGTIAGHAFKVARANPIHALRYE